MRNPRLANRYAKSLITLAQEMGSTEQVRKDMQYLHDLCTASRDFVVMLRSPIINADKKLEVIQSIIKDQISSLTLSFVSLLVKKSREVFLIEMTQAFEEQYKELNNIQKVTLTTAVPLQQEEISLLQTKIGKAIANNAIDLHIVVDKDIIGGFVLEVKDKLFDASIRRDLMDIKKQFVKNLYIAEI